jgi:hypothetical protein
MNESENINLLIKIMNENKRPISSPHPVLFREIDVSVCFAEVTCASQKFEKWLEQGSFTEQVVKI